MLRIAGTPPLIAQAPTETRMRQCFAEFPQLPDVVLVRAAAFDEADIDGPVEGLLVVERRDVEIDEIGQFENALVDVEQRHVAAEAAGQRAGGEPGLCRVIGAAVMACGLPLRLDVAADRRLCRSGGCRSEPGSCRA